MKPSPETSDVGALVERAQAGSAAAFGELVARFESPLFNFLLRRTSCPEDAEEIAQDALVRAWQRLSSYDRRWSFSTWLFTLARRLAATRARSSAPSRRDRDALDRMAVHADPSGELSRREERASLWATADLVLGEEQRSALWLRYAEDLSVPEIAKVLGRSSVGVRVILFRARTRLARHLAPELPERSAPRAPTSTRAMTLEP